MEKNYTINYANGRSLNMFGSVFVDGPDFIKVNGVKVAKTKEVKSVVIQDKWEGYKIEYNPYRITEL